MAKMIENTTSKAVILAPFWGSKTHVGVKRIERFVRWLQQEGISVVLICASKKEYVINRDWGLEIAVQDPFGFYGGSDVSTNVSRKPNKLRRFLALLLFNPDPTIVWSRRVARNISVLSKVNDAKFIISSSPPESVHIAGAKLAKKVGAKFIVDLRDGWLDVPLKPFLQKYWWQRLREGRVERKVLKQADKIFISTNGLYNLLTERLAFVKHKTTLLTNGYSVKNIPISLPKSKNDKTVNLLYAGNFLSSSSLQCPTYLFRSFFYWAEKTAIQGKIKLLSNLTPADLADINNWKNKFQKTSWQIDINGMVSLEELKKELLNSDGLLLLAGGFYALTGKLFEYLPTGKPILAVTQKNSELWNFAKDNPQMFLVDYTCADKYVDVISDFIKVCQNKKIFDCLPKQYSEDYLKDLFINAVL